MKNLFYQDPYIVNTHIFCLFFVMIHSTVLLQLKSNLLVITMISITSYPTYKIKINLSLSSNFIGFIKSVEFKKILTVFSNDVNSQYCSFKKLTSMENYCLI